MRESKKTSDWQGCNYLKNTRKLTSRRWAFVQNFEVLVFWSSCIPTNPKLLLLFALPTLLQTVREFAYIICGNYICWQIGVPVDLAPSPFFLCELPLFKATFGTKTSNLVYCLIHISKYVCHKKIVTKHLLVYCTVLYDNYKAIATRTTTSTT